jgi:erythromycin esterase
MRNYNVLGRGKIEFWGFDMQYPNVAIDNVTDFIMKTDITYSDSLRLLYNIVSASSEEMKRLFPDKRKGKAGRWYNAAFQVFNHLLTNRSNYLKSYDTLTVEQIIQDSRIVVQGAEIYVEGKRSRDECMAANVEWVREHIAKKNKLVLWAHNGHVSKLRHRMGDYLNQKYGGEMIVFGFAFYTGRYTAVGDNGLGIYSTSLPEPGSIEQILHNTAIEEMLIDLRNANNSHKTDWLSKKLEFRSIGAKAMDYAFYPTVITNEFDVLIYFDKTTPSKLLDKRVK